MFTRSFACLLLLLIAVNGFNIGKFLSKSVKKTGLKFTPSSKFGKGSNGGNGGIVPPKLGATGAAGDDKEDSSPLAQFLAAYDRETAKNPILIKGLTSFIGFSLGDLLAQKFIDKKEKLDLARLLRLASFGLIIHGPTGHFFYGFLDGKMPGTGPVTVASKVAIDQILWNPIFGCMFFTYMTLAEGKNFDAVVTKIKSDLWNAVRGSWYVWPLAHTINFAFIPNSQRLLYINSIQIFYNMFLSVIANKK